MLFVASRFCENIAPGDCLGASRNKPRSCASEIQDLGISGSSSGVSSWIVDNKATKNLDDVGYKARGCLVIVPWGRS